MTTQITVQDATNIVAVNIETSHTTNVVISRTAIGTMAHAETANTANTANYANFAGTAYSVAGANVSGYVANATHANVADSANSVAAGNISGTINFATYAGTANAVAGANVSGAVGLATYATTANAVAGANVSGTVANATYATTAGSATTAGTVTTNAQPNITSVGTLTGLTSSANISAPFFIGNVVGNISGNLVVPGTNTSVLYNQLGSAGASDAFKFDYAANVLTVIGNISSTNFSGSGAALTSINGANVSEVANASYATTANAVAGANVSGEVATANYASYAGNVTIAGQGNITSLGNLTGLTVNTGNVVLPTITVIPAGNTVGVAGAPIGLITVTDYGNLNYPTNLANPLNLFSVIKARGNSTTPLPAANNDQTLRAFTYVYTGNGYARAAGMTMSAPSAANSLYTAANVAYTPGIVAFTTGNPFGNITSNTSTSAYNVYQFNQNGRLAIIQGAGGSSTSHNIYIQSYGSLANGGGVGGTTIIARGRGNGEAGGNLLLAHGDTLGGTYFMAMSANGTANLATSASIIATVDTTYGSITPNNPVPSKIVLQTSNGTSSLRNFVLDGDGNITLPLDTSSINYANGSPYGGGGTATALNSDPANVIISGGSSGQVLSTDGSGNLSWAAGGTPGGSDQQVQFNNAGAFGGDGNLTFNTIGSLNIYGKGTLDLEGDSTGGFIVGLSGGAGDFTVLPQCTFNRWTDDHHPLTYSVYRARGNRATPLAVETNDTIFSQYTSVYAGVGYEYTSTGSFSTQVKTNDGVGNIAVTTTYQGAAAGSDFNIDGYTDINLNGNVNIGTNNFVKYAAFTISALTAITGSVGQTAAVSDSAGMLAYWDTTNSRWSYVHDNSAV